MRLKHFALCVALTGAGSLSAEGFRQALPGYAYEFPRDHGAHPDFETEWWYYTGNLAADGGREFGFELTIFRNAIVPLNQRAEGGLKAEEILLGHFAISDVESRRHESWEAIGRKGFGQTDYSTETLDIRLQDWTILRRDDGTMELHAARDHAALDLVLAPVRSPVIHGRNGIHQKAEGTGKASHYISITRSNTTGSITWQNEVIPVEGQSWMDHEFFSDSLSDEEVGWDWFALQLDDGTDLMVYQLRRADGTHNQQSSGTVVESTDSSMELPHGSYTIEATGEWTSPDSGATYPMGWIIRIPEHDAELEVIPAFEAQEMLTTRHTGVIYWEGAVRVDGTWRGEPTSGKGFVELVGYAAPFRSF